MHRRLLRTHQEHASPIQHVIYIIKENRTYDQVLGDMEKGNGDKSLNLFGEQITPNLHQLAREFILYDNFYENADVSADGHNWASAAIAPDYTVKTVAEQIRARRRKSYDFEGGEPANTPPAGYIWDNALEAGLTVRDYGEWTTNIPLKRRRTDHARLPRSEILLLLPHVDMNYRGFDLEYPESIARTSSSANGRSSMRRGKRRNLIIVRMGNDHTQGTSAGALTPFSYAADNDYAVGHAGRCRYPQQAVGLDRDLHH